MKARASHVLGIAAISLLIWCLPKTALAQLNENCTVSVLNRNVRVNPDGSWVLPNIPANFGQVKARATCVQNGVTIFGESAFFTVPANGVTNLPNIVLGAPSMIPVSVTISPATLSLTAAGQSSQIVATAIYPDGSTRNVTGGITGTAYTTSNPAIGIVTVDGLVTAVSSGTIILQATNDGAAGIGRASVVLSTTDSDADGIPDDVEVSLGLDPRNPVDAQEDFDRDDITNFQESQLGTNIRKSDTDSDGLSDGDEVNTHHTSPLLADTDGDKIPDGVEILTASNPLDPTSYDLKKAAATSVVLPPSLVLTTSVVFPVASQLLSWKVTLIDGKTTLDMTTDSRSLYASSNLTICNFGSEKGRIFAGSPGNCIVTIRNNTLSVGIPVTVQNFNPVPLSFVSIPGSTNNVDVSGNYAYVAAGSTGLQVVDVSDRAHPHLVASRDTPGNANDVVIAGNYAYVADGPAGLQIIDISNPLAPVIRGSYDTPGEASDVVVRGTLAYVADGSQGLQIIDVTDSSAPVRLGFIVTPGTAQGVDADPVRQIATIAAGGNGLYVLSIANPAAPFLLNTLPGGNVMDVAISGNFVFLADYARSFTSVDLTNPSAPILGSSTNQTLGGFLTDVAVFGNLAAGADQFFVNGVPLIDVSNPPSPQPRLILNFSNFGDDNGLGIAMDSGYVYLTTDRSRLLIGQYQSVQDSLGIAPTIQITSPIAGIPVIRGSTVSVTANAVDDVAIASVSFLVNGQALSTDTTSPYQLSVTIPIDVSTITFGAMALDLGGNTGTATPVTVNVIPDPLTTVTGTIVDANSAPISGAIVSTGGLTTTSSPDGTFVLANVPTILGNTVTTASFTRPDGVVLAGRSTPIPPVRGGITAVGTITMRPIPVISSINPRFAFPGETVVGFKVSGANLMGSTFVFTPPGSLTLSSVTIAGDGKSAVFNLSAATGASGSFTLVATNSVGTSDPNASIANRVVVPANPEADTDGDGVIDGLELIFGSDPADRDSFPNPNLLSLGDITSTSVAVRNNVAPYSVLPTSLTEVSLPVVVRNDVTPFASIITEQTKVSAPVLVRNNVPPQLGDITLVSLPVVIKNLIYPFSALTEIISAAVLVHNDPLFLPLISSNSASRTSPSSGNSANNSPAPPELELRATGLAIGATSVVEGQTFVLGALASAEVRTVKFLVNGVSYFVDDRPQFEALLTVPVGMKQLTVVTRAVAADDTELASRTFDLPIVGAGNTTLDGRTVDENGNPIAGANLSVVLDGLQAEYFDFQNLAALPDLTNIMPSSTGTLTTVNIRNPQTVFGMDPLGTTFAPDFAGRFQGWLRVTQAGVYRFSLGVEAGGRLRIGGQTVIDVLNGTGTYRESDADLNLAVGLIPIELTFYQGAGNTQLQLSWTPPGGEKAVIRPESFAAMPQSLSATSDSAGNFHIANVPSSIDRVQIVAGAEVGGKVYLGSTDRIPLIQAGQQSETIVLRPNP